MLLEENIDVNVVDLKGLTPLHYAAREGNVEVLEVLLAGNASYKIEDVKGRTALDCVVEDPDFGGSARTQIIKALTNAGADVMKLDSGGGTALHRAVKTSFFGEKVLEGIKDTIKVLVEYGVELDSRDRYGRIVLHFAIGRGQWRVVKLLFELGGSLAVPPIIMGSLLWSCYDPTWIGIRRRRRYFMRCIGGLAGYRTCTCTYLDTCARISVFLLVYRENWLISALNSSPNIISLSTLPVPGPRIIPKCPCPVPT